MILGMYRTSGKWRGTANSLRFRDAFIRHLIGSSLVQVMARRLLGAKPLPEPVVTYYQLDP